MFVTVASMAARDVAVRVAAAARRLLGRALDREAWRAVDVGFVSTAATYMVCATYVWLIGWLIVGMAGMLALGFRPLVVMSGSMEPRIRPGDVLMVDPDASGFVENDIITFRRPGEETLVTHRIERFEDDGLIVTKGDANLVNDGTRITEDDVVGRVRVLFVYAGVPKVWLDTGKYALVVAWLVATSLSLVTVASARRLFSAEVAEDAPST